MQAAAQIFLIFAAATMMMAVDAVSVNHPNIELEPSFAPSFASPVVPSVSPTAIRTMTSLQPSSNKGSVASETTPATSNKDKVTVRINNNNHHDHHDDDDDDDDDDDEKKDKRRPLRSFPTLWIIPTFAGLCVCVLYLLVMYHNHGRLRSTAEGDNKNPKTDLVVLMDSPEIFFAQQLAQGKDPLEHPVIKMVRENIDIESLGKPVLVKSIKSKVPQPIARKSRWARRQKESVNTGSGGTKSEEWLEEKCDETFVDVRLDDDVDVDDVDMRLPEGQDRSRVPPV